MREYRAGTKPWCERHRRLRIESLENRRLLTTLAVLDSGAWPLDMSSLLSGAAYPQLGPVQMVAGNVQGAATTSLTQAGTGALALDMATNSASTAGGLDGTFAAGTGGNHGQVTTNFEGNGWDHANAVVMDNGNILVVGTTGNGQFGLARYVDQPGAPNDGALDTTFGARGMVTTAFAAGNASAAAVAVDDISNTFVVAGMVVDSNGHNELALARYNSVDGSLDTTFGTGGLLTSDLGSGWEATSGVAVNNRDQSIFVAGSRNGHFAVLRYNSDGTRDTTFGRIGGGIVTPDFGGTDEKPCAIALDINREILVAGTSTQAETGKDFALARYYADGTPDGTFGNRGFVTTDFGYAADDVATAMAIQPNDGQIVLAGYTEFGSDNVVLARYRADGSLDPAFGNEGEVVTYLMAYPSIGNGCPSGVAVQSDGAIVVSGSAFFNSSGTLDTQRHFAVARFQYDGTPDSSFGTGRPETGFETADFSAFGFSTDVPAGIIVAPSNRLIVAGTASQANYSSFAVACYDSGLPPPVVIPYHGPLVLRAGADQQTNAGLPLHISRLGTFSDTSMRGTFTFTIDWGDGSIETSPAQILYEGSIDSPLIGGIDGQHTYGSPGLYGVAVTITDPAGNSDEQSLVVTVNYFISWPVSQAPAGTDSTVNIVAGAPYVMNVAEFGFTDPNNSPPDNFTQVKITTLPTAGSLVLAGAPMLAGQFVTVEDLAAGNLVYTPTNAVRTSRASFTFQVQDDGSTDNGGVILDPVPKTLTFNLPPVAVDDSFAVNENTALNVSPSARVLTNDTDSDGDPLSAVLAAGPRNGTLTLDPRGSFTYTPNAYFYGTDTFQYKANDSAADSNVATVTINVLRASQAPAGTDAVVTTGPGAKYTLKAADFGFTDPHDTPLDTFTRVKITTLPTMGRLRLAGRAVVAGQFITVNDIAKGELTFTAPPGACRTSRPEFTFQVEDSGSTANGGVILDPTPRTMTFNVMPTVHATIVARAELALSAAELGGGKLVIPSAGKVRDIVFAEYAVASRDTKKPGEFVGPFCPP